MKALVILPRIRVENANAVSGMTWGFPGVSPFLGFCHALDRKLCAETEFDSVLSGCAIICHSHQCHAVSDDYGEYGFSLTRNPLTQQGSTAPFNEEGRMHLIVSLVIEWCVDVDDYRDSFKDDGQSIDDGKWLSERMTRLVAPMRIAGGLISGHDEIAYLDIPSEEALRTGIMKKILFSSLPGFALVDRSELLTQQLEVLQEKDPDAELLDAWMEFGALRYRPTHRDENETAEWLRIPLPDSGWYVPLVVGYQGVAPLQPAGTVHSSRSASVPYVPVESIYGVGQWLSPHRVRALESLLWRYSFLEPQQYRFENNYSATSKNSIEGI